MMKFYSSRSLLYQRSGQQSYAKVLKKLMVFALVMCISTTVFAQRTVKGQVQNEIAESSNGAKSQ